MDKLKTISWKTFRETLEQHPDLILQFQYAENKWVDASYHITEIKQAPIVSVDCGGVMNSWTEIIVQLWEPQGENEGRAMKVSKALSIINLVEKSLPLNPNGAVKIEFGNSQFHTRQMFPNDFIISEGNLIIDLRPDAVQCKAIERGGSCGITVTGEECCTPETVISIPLINQDQYADDSFITDKNELYANDKPKVELIKVAVNGNVCTPGSGCC